MVLRVLRLSSREYCAKAFGGIYGRAVRNSKEIEVEGVSLCDVKMSRLRFS
jgi:hypothetical protein